MVLDLLENRYKNLVTLEVFNENDLLESQKVVSDILTAL